MGKVPDDLDFLVRQATVNTSLLEGVMDQLIPFTMHLPPEKIQLYKKWLVPLLDTLEGGSTHYGALVVMVALLKYRETRFQEVIDLLVTYKDNNGENIPVALLVPANSLIGGSYRGLGELERALEFFQQNIRYDQYEREGHKFFYSVTLYHIAEIYGELQEFEKKLQKHKQSQQFNERSNNKDFYFRALNGIGRAYQGLQDYDNALEYFLKVEKESNQICTIPFRARNLHDLGCLYAELNNVDNALDYFEQALCIRREQKLVNASITTLMEMGRILMANDRIEDAIVLLNEALHYADNLGVKKKQLQLYKLLSEVYEYCKRYDVALEYFKQFNRLKEEVDDVNKTRVENQRIREMNTLLAKQKDLIENQKIKLEGAIAELSSVNNNLVQANISLRNRTQQLHATLEANNEILKITAHDLKNPLCGIIGLVDLVIFESEEAHQSAYETVMENVPLVKEEANRMLQIIIDLLDKHRAGEQPALIKERVTLNEIVIRVIRWNTKQAQEKGILLHFHSCSPFIVDVDMISIQRVLDNYVSNAIKFSPRNSNIWVEINPEFDDLDGKSMVKVSVLDEGPGLSEEDKKNVFGKMQSLSAKPTGGEHSSGLGLYIVKTLVELHDGRVGVESEYGKGASFWFALPVLET
ncbi:MAG: tetratricopeptide repeat-containing sensor histidine kinase [Rhodothermaceae bacterium]|nr:tetratricopeptide repeat-containing sensor histidine kinase [Rhodothermaceae bacterium]